MKKKLIILPGFAFLLGPAVFAQRVELTIMKGNTLYRQKQYDLALASYDDALKKDPTNTVAKFNRANTAYRLSRADEAAKAFDQLAFSSKEPADKARAYYNKGVILSAQKRLEESIEAYKNALRQDPTDNDARENLQKALLELKKRNPPPKKEDNKKKKQEQNKKQQEQPKMNQSDADQKLKLLQQKERELQERIQKQKSKTGGNLKRDW